MLTELEKKGLFLNRLLEISADGFVLIDENNKILDISETYSNKFKEKRSDIIGRSVLEIIKDSRLPEYVLTATHNYEKDAIHRLTRNAQPYHDEYCFVTRGTVFSDDQTVIGAVSQVQFIEKTVKLSQCMTSLDEELQYYKNELMRLTEEVYSLNNVIGNSPEMQHIKADAIKASEVDFNVLLTGKTGTGKEVFANAIHYSSARRSRPFIKINCSAIPAELFESELFGYTEGSFTGAKKGGKRGKFELANKGTIFLDEIAEMPMSMQVKLLRVIQERKIDVIGSEKQVPIDVRIIAATNKDLKELIKTNNFREDLYYRLNVINIHIPPLKERTEDIVPLMNFFLEDLNKRYEQNIHISKEVENLCKRYDWPGNIRELKNAVERMYTFVEGNEISLQHVPATLLQGFANEVDHRGNQSTLEDMLNEVEKNYLAGLLKENGCNIKKTAEILGMHRNTLYRKLEKHNLTRLTLQNK